jgi:ribosome-binding factor A
MKTHQSNRTHWLCAEWREGDGLAPRFEPRDQVKQQARKDQQLSKQAHRALSLFLEGECKHPDLLGVEVLAVQYEPAKQRLCVNVGSTNNDAEGEAILAALKHSQAVLRSVVAASLHRKKVPALSFYYVGSHSTGGESCPFKP